ncbi:hypothetical protein [Pseudoduganella umbonata]|uniref:Thioredoxin domain-containing protein n=1 Tax=Pseudoduganella umbonata TaxID=864828 RepID=A0A4P8HZZ3_9BURK|nr:hypothetical protein [Pseudoduganella umbonata]MBB3224088.1 hypothetical protein [Pseudoduganella umbonata]QCP14045.1 hypothetical protein FCL38_29245 [Pseudoduganella umbonata]
MKYLKWLWMLLPAGACSLAIAAAPVTELKPYELADFVRRHDLVAVQFTSPDRYCTYCYTADETFDQAAAASTVPGLTFARVQWPAWSAIPDFKPLFENLFGLPAQLVFKNGSLHGRANGHPVTAELLLAQFADLIRGPATPHRADMAYLPKPSAQPLTDDERRLVDLEFRRVYLGKVLANCSNRFPAQASAYAAAFDVWHVRRKPELERARLLIAQHTSPADTATVKALFASGHKAMGVLQVETLGVPGNRDPLPEECAKVIDGIVALP